MKKWNCWKKKTNEELQRAQHEGVLKIQPLVMRSLLHSSSSLECAQGKHIMRKYNLRNNL